MQHHSKKCGIPKVGVLEGIGAWEPLDQKPRDGVFTICGHAFAEPDVFFSTIGMDDPCRG